MLANLTNAGVENAPSASRGRDPRWVPNPARPSRWLKVGPCRSDRQRSLQLSGSLP